MIGLLSIPTWIIHFSSVIEWALAMLLFWQVGRKLHNIWLQRMSFVMIPYMLSGWCAIIYHMSADEWGWLNDTQAYLTFAGSSCFALWAFLVLRSLTNSKALQAKHPAAKKEEARRG
ncbi:MAG TPA: DUF2499 domain-containing protein [Chloroflexia bacterium]|nr:DUF2499 domain-containing protein [Chloroflexia bacterium]